MKKISLLLLSLFCAATIFAQQFTVSTSPEFKHNDDDLQSQYFKLGDSYIRYVTEYGGPQFGFTAKLSGVVYDITLYRYNAQMQEQAKLSLGNGEKTFSSFPPVVFIFNEKIEVLYYRYDKDAETATLFVAQVNPVSLVLEDTKELFKLNQKNAGLLFGSKKLENVKLYPAISPDNSKALITCATQKVIMSCIVDKQFNVTRNTIITPKNLDDFYLIAPFLDNNGNKYFSYHYDLGDLNQRGVITEAAAGGPPRFQKYDLGIAETWANDMYFAPAKDKSKLFMYANYYGNYHNEGVLLTTIDTGTFKIAKPNLFTYPADYRKRLLEDKFAIKAKGQVSVSKVFYTLTEFDNGAVAFLGVPSYNETKQSTHTSSNSSIPMITTTITNYTGPIMGIFIQPGAQNAVFTLIPRLLTGAKPGAAVFIKNHNQLICLYGDKEKYLAKDIKESSGYTKDPEDLVLAAAVYNSNGDLLSRNKIAEKAGSDNAYLLSGSYFYNGNSLLIPVGRHRITPMREYDQYERLVVVELK